MSLQSKYRLERDKILTVENERYYFAYKLTENKTEAHVTEVYIEENLRGNSGIYFQEIFDYLKSIHATIKHIVGFIWPNVLGSEKSIVSLVKFGFKIHSIDSEKIILVLEV